MTEDLPAGVPFYQNWTTRGRWLASKTGSYVCNRAEETLIDELLSLRQHCQRGLEHFNTHSASE